MAQEIERKFLVEGDFASEVASSARIVQGYICSEPGKSVRIRIRGDKGYITIKGPSFNGGLSRFEWEKEIPLEEAEMLLVLCGPLKIEKERNLVPFAGHIWEVDVFHGANEGLVVAEIELGSEDEKFELPSWVGREVTGDRRFYNTSLLMNPLPNFR